LFWGQRGSFDAPLVSWTDSVIHRFFISFLAPIEPFSSPALSAPSDPTTRRDLTAQELQAIQAEKLAMLLDRVTKRPFFTEHFSASKRGRDANVSVGATEGDASAVEIAVVEITGQWDRLAGLPLMTKADLLGQRRGDPAKIFDLPRHHYTRLHRTSGTRGFPMAVLDTPADWQWWLSCWDFVLDAAHVTTDDVALMAFSFGPFIGFWTAHEALVRRGTTVVPAGGMSSENRLRMMLDYQCTVVCCTPTYALHLAEVAAKIGVDLASGPVTRLIVAGEPGGSVPATRAAIESTWGATVIDHTGASEVGAWGYGSVDGRGIHVIETEFIAECVVFPPPESDNAGRPRIADEGEPAELVLTGLGRFGGPVIRYRTGDIVRGYRHHDLPDSNLFLDGGVIGRADDMIVVRGVNVYPSSIEAIVRELDPTAEFRITLTRQRQMDQLAIEIEATADIASELADRLADRLAMRVDVAAVDAGTLPRFEAKAKRLVDLR
jgi:phenylacetate-CoA ligase